jgi:pimeloyl-ACP methyl ester carboxylesterase
MKRLNFIILLLISCFAVSISAQTNQSKIQSKFAEFGGAKVHYYDSGKGKNALVFIHGWACSADFWNRSISEFPEYRVIAVDLIGHGKSDKPIINYSMDYFAKSVEAVLRDANVKKAVLAGHSMGTPVARQFYRLYPERTLGLIIVDGSLRTGTKEEVEQFIAPLRANYKKNSTEFVDGMLQPVRDEKLKQEIRAAMLAAPAHVGLSAMEGMIDHKIWTNDKINVPVLAVLAESPWWKPDEKEFFQSVAPNLDFRMWQGYSHFLMMEQPAVFNKTVKLFIAKNKLL